MRLGLTPDNKYYCLPDVRGKRVLEVGCGAGWLATHIVSEGAQEYLGVDVWPPEGDRQRTQSSELYCRFRYGDVTVRGPLPYDKVWDIVVCFDVLYHLVEPLQALINLRDLTSDVLVLGTAIHPGDDTFMWFDPGYRGDPTNLWYPTRRCLMAMFRHLSLTPTVRYVYKESEVIGTFHDRICIHCQKQ